MRKVIIMIGILMVVWLLYAYTGRKHAWTSPELYLAITESISSVSSCERNIVGMQPYMVTADYQSEKHFYEKLKGYFKAAHDAGYFHDYTVVALPEYLGTWLVVSDEKRGVTRAGSITSAMTQMVLSNPWQLLKALQYSKNEKDIVAAAIFRMKANDMARIYASVFTSLAKEYHVTISAGSIVLPDPFVDQQMVIGVNPSGPLFNASFMFHPDGSIDPQHVRKAFPITSEQPFVSAYPIDKLPVYDLNIGRTTVLVCADSWYPESYQAIERLKPEFVLVNSYCAGDGTMDSLWKGYDGASLPADVDTTDIGRITEREAWIKYALPGRLNAFPKLVGVNVFLRGELWDLGTDGEPFFVNDGELMPLSAAAQGGIWNLCLDAK